VAERSFAGSDSLQLEHGCKKSKQKKRLAIRLIVAWGPSSNFELIDAEKIQCAFILKSTKWINDFFETLQ